MRRIKFSSFLVKLLFVVMLIFTAGCSVISRVPGVAPVVWGLSVDIGKPFKIVISERAKGWGFVSHPVIWRISDTRLVLSYHLLGDVSGGGKGRVPVDWPAYSDDGGHTWLFGDPYLWVDGKPDHPTEMRRGEIMETPHLGYRSCVCQLNSGERVALDISVSLKGGKGSTRRIWSEDGVSWHGPHVVAITVPPELSGMAYFMPNGVVMDDNTLLCVAQAQRGGEEKFRSILFRSTDKGASFEYLSTIADSEDAPWGTEGANETGITMLSNGELLAVARTGMNGLGHDKMVASKSSDDGKTWQRRKMILPGVWPQLLRMSNGVLVCAFGRPGNSLAFSLDDGKTWIKETAITGADIRTSGYVGIVEAEPGRLLVVYDVFNTTLSKIWLWDPPDPVNVIYGVFVDVKYRG